SPKALAPRVTGVVSIQESLAERFHQRDRPVEYPVRSSLLSCMPPDPKGIEKGREEPGGAGQASLGAGHALAERLEHPLGPIQDAFMRVGDDNLPVPARADSHGQTEEPGDLAIDIEDRRDAPAGATPVQTILRAQGRQ